MKAYLRARIAQWVLRRQGRDTLPLTLRRQRLYILPSRAGVGFGVLLLFMLLAGLNYANSTALFITFLLGGFMLVAMHLCHRNLHGVRLISAIAPPTFAPRDGYLQLALESGAAANRYRIAAGVDHGQTIAADLPGGGSGQVVLPIEAPRRGRIRIDRLCLTTTHPFGLFRAWTWVHVPVEMLVYPRASGALPLPAESGRRPGVRSSREVGADEWIGLRPYRDGDSPRQVDWKAYARAAPLLVKEYAATGSELRLLRFDSLTGLQTEARLEQLARWVLDAEAAGERYGLELPGTSIPPGQGAEHRHRCLTALAVFGVDPAPRFGVDPAPRSDVIP